MEVLTDLPDKIYQKIILEMNPKEYSIYDSIEEGVANEFIGQTIKNPLTIMLRLRQYTASLKSKVVIELVDRLLEEDDMVVIVDYFKESLIDLKNHYGDIAGLHTGDITVEDRNTIVKDFQSENGNIKIFLGSIQTCSYGLTLTAANKLFILTLPYSVGEYDQVSDRLHRLGQKDTVNIYPLIFRETIDEYVFDAIESKRREIVKVMDNEEYVSKVSETLINEVIKKIVKKHGKSI
jgi:SWI/SNF-related matrix-associated actin-dependent regulator 1 of chromatin subfamily A